MTHDTLLNFVTLVLGAADLARPIWRISGPLMTIFQRFFLSKKDKVSCDLRQSDPAPKRPAPKRKILLSSTIHPILMQKTLNSEGCF